MGWGETKANVRFIHDRATWFHKGFTRLQPITPDGKDKLNSIDFDEQIEASLPSSAEPTDNELAGKRSSKRGGPRTYRGKERSKQNALKYGIFSRAVLLEDESVPEFKSLKEGLYNGIQPEGTLECLLVDKLVSNLWRSRRLLLAEKGEIQKSLALADPDLLKPIRDEGLPHLPGLLEKRPFLQKIANPGMTVICLDFMKALLAKVEAGNIDVTFASYVVTLLYEQNVSLTSAFHQYFHKVETARTDASGDINSIHPS